MLFYAAILFAFNSAVIYLVITVCQPYAYSDTESMPGSPASDTPNEEEDTAAASPDQELLQLHADARNNQEGMRRRVCRCGECISGSRKHTTRRSE